MGRTVYVDLFFLINFSMDFLCFFLAGKLLARKISLPRMLIASTLGGLYANVSLLISLSGILGVLVDVAVCILMCLIAFWKNGGVIKNTLVYIGTSMVLGGFMTAIFQLLDKADLPFDAVDSDGISVWMLAILAVVSALICVFAGRFFRQRATRKTTSLTIHINNKKKTLLAFCDSGNLLSDPISGKLCIIADAEALRGTLPDSVIDLSLDACAAGDVTNTDILRRIRLVPTKTATGRGMMVCMRVDKLVIGEGKEAHEVDALLGFCNISELGDAHSGCLALIPTELLV